MHFRRHKKQPDHCVQTQRATASNRNTNKSNPREDHQPPTTKPTQPPNQTAMPPHLTTSISQPTMTSIRILTSIPPLNPPPWRLDSVFLATRPPKTPRSTPAPTAPNRLPVVHSQKSATTRQTTPKPSSSRNRRRRKPVGYIPVKRRSSSRSSSTASSKYITTWKLNEPGRAGVVLGRRSGVLEEEVAWEFSGERFARVAGQGWGRAMVERMIGALVGEGCI